MNIEELARKAGGLYMLSDLMDEEVEVFRRVELYRFASLVLEQAAQKCMRQQSDLRTRQKYAEAIRAMKPTQEG